MHGNQTMLAGFRRDFPGFGNQDKHVTKHSLLASLVVCNVGILQFRSRVTGKLRIIYR